MSQVTFASMRGLVHPHVPGCPVPLIDQQLLSMSREFLRRSQAWRVDLDPISTVIGQTDYNITNTSAMTSAKGEVSAVISVTLSDRLLNPFLDYNIGYDGAVLELVDAPVKVVANAIQIVVAAVPALDATGIESHLYNLWGETIARGAVYRLMSVVGKPYFNADGAAYYRAEYGKGLEIARHREQAGRMQGGLKVAYPGFI